MLHVRQFRHNSAVIEAKAKQIIAKLRQYHRLGQTSDPAKIKSTVDLAVEYGIGVNTAFKARAFARLYTQRELNALCGLRRPDDLPLNWAYVPYLLTVKDKRQRAQFEKQAAKRGWTAPELYAEIRRKRPNERKAAGGGRPPKPTKVAGAGLSWIIQQSNTWIRYCNAIRPALVDLKFGRQPQRAHKEVESSISVLHQLAQSAEGLATSLTKQLAASTKKMGRAK